MLARSVLPLLLDMSGSSDRAFLEEGEEDAEESSTLGFL